MSNFLNTLSAIGTLAMAATPIVALGAAAHAAEFQPAHIRVADLDLSRPAGVAVFRARVDGAAERMCRGSVDLSSQRACRSAVQEEAVERLGSTQRQDLRSAEASSRSPWQVASR